MKKLFVFVSLLALCLCGSTVWAQVPESAEWAIKIKAEGLNNSKIEELSQFMTIWVPG